MHGIRERKGLLITETVTAATDNLYVAYRSQIVTNAYEAGTRFCSLRSVCMPTRICGVVREADYEAFYELKVVCEPTGIVLVTLCSTCYLNDSYRRLNYRNTMGEYQCIIVDI